MAETFGQYIKKIRLKTGLTLGAVEILTEDRLPKERISHSYLSQIERDVVPPPSVDKMKVLARVYRVPAEELMKKAGILPGQPFPELEVLHPKMRTCFSRILALSREGQGSVAEMVIPVVDHIERDERIGREYRIAAKTVSEALETVSGVLPQTLDHALRLLVAEYEATEEQESQES